MSTGRKLASRPGAPDVSFLGKRMPRFRNDALLWPPTLERGDWPGTFFETLDDQGLVSEPASAQGGGDFDFESIAV